MNEEEQEPTLPQLPYEPIKFVYTETIGSIDEKFREIIDPYTWTYEDLLEPKIIYGKSKIEYYLFHVAPIYNWLRHIGSGMLAEYVMKVDENKGKGNNFNNSGNNFKGNNNNKSTSTLTPFSLETWKFEMKHYIAQWEIAKLCASAKIKILTTRTETNEKGNKNFMNGKNNNNTKQKHNEEQILCTHLIKKDKFTTDYVLNTLAVDTRNNLPKLECPIIYCQECQQEIKIKSEIIKYPFAPYFNKYHDKEFTIITNELQQTKITYQLVVVYCLDKVYVKSSGGVWYEMLFKENKKSIVSFERIDNKAGLVFVYQQKVNIKGDKVLRKAEPVKVEEMKKKEKGLVDLAKFITKERNVNGDDDSEEDEQQLKDYKKKILEKPKPNVAPVVVNKSQTATNNLESQSKVNLTATNQPQEEKIEEEQQQDDDEPLEDMTKNPLPIVLNKKKTERKLFKEYKKTVESLLPKPKEKDEYEKEYDKGKTKKIHKNRQEFRTADFFQLYNKIKGNKNSNGVQQQRENDDNKDDMLNEGNDRSEIIRDGNRRGRDNGNKNDNGEGDDDYNIVCQPKRSDRFRGGRGGRGGGRGGRFGDRDSGRGRGRGTGGSRGSSQRGGGFKSHGDKHRNGNSHTNSNSYNSNKGHNRNYSNKHNNTHRNNSHNTN